MSVNDEVEAAASDSFWEVDQFRRTVKRVDDGLHMAQELAHLIAERAEIEREYSRKLQLWSKKWNEAIEKGPEYGTNKAMLLGSLLEAEGLADIHTNIKDKLLEVQADVKKWKHETFKKQMVGGCKETKAFEDEFKKAQKPWAKKLAKVQKCRKDYHNACKLEKTAAAQLSAEGNASADQVKKLQERLDKCRKDIESTKDKYEEALAVLHKYNSTYVDDMTDVFDKTQIFEEKRLRFFKDIMVGVHTSLSIISRSTELPRIYDQLKQTIQMSDAAKDLKWWSQNHGIDMPMSWPTFEEYSTEISTMSRKDKTRTVYLTASDSSLQTASSSDKNGGVPKAPSPNIASREPPAVREQATRVTSSPAHVVPRQASYDTRLNPFADDDTDDESASAAEEPSPSAGSSTHNVAEAVGPSGVATAPEVIARPPRDFVSPKKTSNAEMAGGNPFDDEDDEDLSALPGVPVEALYNYVGQEEDELSFKTGEKFEKLKDKDDQGWCTGRKDGRIGLYPDNYVKVLSK